MRTIKEIEEQKQKDLEFIISAVTTELHDLAYLEYFGTWENNGGMGWFFDECVQITHKIMLTEGSAYLKWLDHWINTEDDKVKCFSELTNNRCFDWYHMDKARMLFESSYTKDECSKKMTSEHIGCLINKFKLTDEQDELIKMAINYALVKRNELAWLERKVNFDKIIDDLKSNDVDGEMMEYVIKRLGMEEQMVKQLYHDKK